MLGEGGRRERLVLTDLRRVPVVHVDNDVSGHGSTSFLLGLLGSGLSACAHR